MLIEQIFILRHGDYENGHLTGLGQHQITSLYGRMKTFLDGKQVAIYTSPSPRARESAEILGTFCKVVPDEDRKFYSDRDTKLDPAAAYQKIFHAQFHNHVIIVMTHLEYVQALPGYIAQQRWGGSPDAMREIARGQGWRINCLEKSVHCA